MKYLKMITAFVAGFAVVHSFYDWKEGIIILVLCVCCFTLIHFIENEIRKMQEFLETLNEKYCRGGVRNSKVMPKSTDLNLFGWQYTVRHKDTSCFSEGDRVFLKSNPEWPMLVYSVDKTHVTTMWKNERGHVQSCKWPPECILQYKYAALLTYKNTFLFCLN